MKKRSPVTLPSPGAAYLVPLADGRFGLCRVLRTVTIDERPSFGDCVLVATSEWIGTAPPPLNEPSLRAILIKTHHSWNAVSDVYFVSEPPPPTHRLLGEIPPTPEDRAISCNSIGRWSSAAQTLLQWRWDHDRDALLADEAREALDKAARAAAADARDAKRRAELTWEKLAAKARFEHWRDEGSDAIVDASRKLCADAIAALRALGPKEKRKARGVVKTLVEGFNELDEAHDHFIDTIAREDICDELAEIAFLAGLPEGIVDEYRNW